MRDAMIFIDSEFGLVYSKQITAECEVEWLMYYSAEISFLSFLQCQHEVLTHRRSHLNLLKWLVELKKL